MRGSKNLHDSNFVNEDFMPVNMFPPSVNDQKPKLTKLFYDLSLVHVRSQAHWESYYRPNKP